MTEKRVEFEDVEVGWDLINDKGWTRRVTGRKVANVYSRKSNSMEDQEVLTTILTSGVCSGEPSIITKESYYDRNWRTTE